MNWSVIICKCACMTTNIIFGLLQLAVSILASGITIGLIWFAYKTLKLQSRSFYEYNRPFITFSIEAGVKTSELYMIIRNTGIRGAKNVKMDFIPPLKSRHFNSDDTNKPINKLEFPFLAPNQHIHSLFDLRTKEQTNNNDIYSVRIRYFYNDNRFDESYQINIESINKVYFKHKTPQWKEI